MCDDGCKLTHRLGYQDLVRALQFGWRWVRTSEALVQFRKVYGTGVATTALNSLIALGACWRGSPQCLPVKHLGKQIKRLQGPTLQRNVFFPALYLDLIHVQLVLLAVGLCSLLP